MPASRPFAAALALLAASAVTAADWPQWRGPNRDGHSADTGLIKEWPKGGPPLAWKANLGGVGFGCPVVVGDRLFVTAAEDDEGGQKEYTLCLGTKDGREVWRTPLPSGNGGYTTDWGSGPRSTPTVEDGFVYTLGARGDLACLRAADGKQVWAVNLVRDFGGDIPGWGYSESVLIDGDKLICTPGGNNGAVLALDKKTGKKLWQSAGLTDEAGYASAVVTEVGGVRQYVTQTQEAAVGVRASDGKLLWRVDKLGRSVTVIPTPVVHDGYAFFTAGYGAGCELLKLEPDGSGGTKATVVYTRNRVLANQHGGVVRVGDYIFGHSDSGGRWVCVEYKKDSAEPVWEYRRFDKGSVIAADGHLYCYGEDRGTVALVEASTDGWKEKGRFDIPEQSRFPRRSGKVWAHPVIANGKLYLRDHELLFCYDVAGK
jgi:outer membrane protein assembly factor BamB